MNFYDNSFFIADPIIPYQSRFLKNEFDYPVTQKMKGFLDGEKKWRFPTTVTESLMSVDYKDIVESGEKAPKEMIEAYDYYVNGNKKANSYASKDIPFRAYNNICDIIGDITTHTVIEYFPSKVDSLVGYKFSEGELEEKLKSLLDSSFDYILYNRTLYYSRKFPVDFYKTFSQNASDLVIISVDGIKSKIDIANNTIVTEQKYSKKMTTYYHLTGLHSNYRGSAIRNLQKVLDYKKLNDILISKFSRVMSNVSGDGKNYGYVYTLNICPMFSKVSPVIRYSYLNNIVTIRVSRCSCSIEYHMIMKLAEVFLDNYDAGFGDSSYTKALALLRAVDPDLFVQQYSRESQVLPVYYAPGQETENSLEFPLGSGRYYGAPPGYYPGLKENRLPNKDEYPLLITCYKTDHSLNPHKLTYKYYNKTFEKSSPNFTIKDCFNFSLTFKVYKEVCLQELYGVNLETYSEFYNEYRYCEEMYNINIIVIRNGNVFIPDHVGPYYWNYYEYRETYIIEQTKKNLKLSYHIVDTDEDLIEEFVEAKLRLTKRSTYDVSIDYVKQHVDFNGKVRMVKLPNGEWIDCVGAPLNVPVENVRDETTKDIERLSKGFFNRIHVNQPDKLLDGQRHCYMHSYK